MAVFGRCPNRRWSGVQGGALAYADYVISPSSLPTVVTRWQRSLLPALLLGEVEQPSDGGAARTPPRSLRDWLVDVVAFAVALAIGAIALAGTWHQHATWVAGLDIALGFCACVALWARRAHPVGVALGVMAVSAVSASAGGAALVALFTVAVLRPPRITAIVGVASVISAVIAAGLYLSAGGYDWSGLGFGAMFTVVALGWGLFVRARNLLVLSLHERAHRLESEQRLRVEQARHAERARIAREMHDVLAHRLSLLSVHAGALEFRPDASAEEIARAAGVIRTSAHGALQELRQVIGLLRDPDDDEAPDRPQPTLTDVPALVAESRDSGMTVHDRIDVAAPDSIPDTLGRAAYRIVQEGLTNARKHAPGSLVQVTIGGDADAGLRVEVLSRPPVGASHAQPAPARLPGTGTGLIGLAERVNLAGGQLEHGPSRERGYVLRATLPWPA
jgi:signal transduction histidine kinase